MPRTSGTNAFPSTAVPYITKLISDFTPVQLQECGSASAAHTIAVVYNPAQGFSNFDENNLVINVDFLPSPNANGVDQFFDHNLMHEASHALQADILKIVNGVNRRGTTADTEGFAQACADRVARDMALAGTRPDELDGGSLSVLWLDTLERINPAAVAAGVWSNSAAHAQPMLTLGEGSYLLAASQTGAGGGGIVEHENALFAADSVTTSPLSAAQRRQIWDATGITLDAKNAGAWMPTDMIQAPTLIAGQTFLYAWPVNPQFPAQMMAQALVVQSNDPATQPIVLAIASGPLTITVRDIHGQVVLGPISADFADTAGIANYILGLQDKVVQGAYTVSVKATVNSEALESHFTVVVIPRSLTGVDTPASFPGQYIIAVDAAGNANGGTLTVTRGTVVPIVPAITGFRIVNPDSSGTFDVIGPSGIERTYTAPTPAPAPWARFILVE